jgi:hypothetical protein
VIIAHGFYNQNPIVMYAKLERESSSDREFVPWARQPIQKPLSVIGFSRSDRRVWRRTLGGMSVESARRVTKLMMAVLAEKDFGVK